MTHYWPLFGPHSSSRSLFQNKLNWMDGNDPCVWYGATCDNMANVVGDLSLSLESNNLNVCPLFLQYSFNPVIASVW